MRALLLGLLLPAIAAAQSYQGGTTSSASIGLGTQNIWSAQQRYTGTGACIDVDGNGVTSSGGLGIVIEDDIGSTSPIASPATVGPAHLVIDSLGQASFLLETHNQTAGSDSVISFNRSRGTGHGSEVALSSADILGTLMWRGWKSTGTGSLNSDYIEAAAIECYTGEAWDATHHGSNCQFYTNPTGSGTTPAAVMALTMGQNVGVKNAMLIGAPGYGADPTAPLHILPTTAAGAAGTIIEGNSAGTHPRTTELVPDRVSIAASTTATTVFTFVTATSGVYNVDVNATARCTATGGSCSATTQVIGARLMSTCTNNAGTVTCGFTALAATGLTYVQDSLNVHAAANPITVVASSANILIKVANPDAVATYVWGVSATLTSSGT